MLKNFKFVFLYLLISNIFLSVALSKDLSFTDDANDLSVLPGRVSRINKLAKLIRIKINFDNIKFFSPYYDISLSSEQNSNKKCEGYIVSKTNAYLLVKIPDIESCIKTVYVSVGSYIHLRSKSYEKALSVASEVVDILLKKKLALNSKIKDEKINLATHLEKVAAINVRYEVLRKKIELEWQDELSKLENDHQTNLRNYKELEIRLNELDHKLEKYRLSSSPFDEDRWALDQSLYFKK